MEHDLADSQALGHGADRKNRLVQRAPRTPGQRAGLDRCALRQDGGTRVPNGRGGHVRRLGVARPSLHAGEFDRDQEIGAVGCPIESVDGQQIGAGFQEIHVSGDIDRRLHHGGRVRIVSIAYGIPLRIAGEVAACHLPPIQVGDETIVVPHLEEQVRIGCVRCRERNADVAGGLPVVHFRAEIGRDVRLIP